MLDRALPIRHSAVVMRKALVPVLVASLASSACGAENGGQPSADAPAASDVPGSAGSAATSAEQSVDTACSPSNESIMSTISDELGVQGRKTLTLTPDQTTCTVVVWSDELTSAEWLNSSRDSGHVWCPRSRRPRDRESPTSDSLAAL